MDEINIYRRRIGRYTSIARQKSSKRKTTFQRRNIKEFKHKVNLPQKIKPKTRQKGYKKQCQFHNKPVLLLIIALLLQTISNIDISQEFVETQIEHYIDNGFNYDDIYNFMNNFEKIMNIHQYRNTSTVTKVDFNIPVLSSEYRCWTCQGTSQVTADSWLRQRTCYFLLGNKGMHCSNGNPRQDGATGDHGEVAMTQETMHLIRERCNESVGFITVGDSCGTGFRVGDCFLITAYHVMDCMIDEIKDRIVHRLDIRTEEAFNQLTSHLKIQTEKDNTESFDDAVKRILTKFMKKTATNVWLLLQCLKDSIDTVTLEFELTNIWKQNCVVDFINHGQFSLYWKIEFGDEESDIMILRLLKSKSEQNYPRALLLDEKYRQHGDIKIIRYLHSDLPKVIVDQHTRVFKDDTELQAAREWAINWWTNEFRDVEESYFREQYSKCCKSVDEDTGKVILRASKSFIQGSSGSPIIYMFNTDGVPVVEMIYQGGYPNFYYESPMKRKDQFKRLDEVIVDSKCFFERGTTMKKLAELLKQYGKVELKEEIFSLPRYSADSKSQEYKEPTDTMKLNVMKWKDNDKFCFVTKGVEAVTEKIQMPGVNYLSVTGIPGSGKTTSIRHAALCLHKNGYTIYPIHNPVQFNHFLHTEKKQLFVIDDPLGVNGVDMESTKQWDKYNETVKNALVKSGNTKFLSSVRIQICNELSLSDENYIFNEKSNCINFSDPEYVLDTKNMVQMLRHCLTEKGEQNVEKTIWAISNQLGHSVDESFAKCFPLLCKVFLEEESVRKDAKSFFSHPFPALTRIFQEMKTKNKYQFCGLILCACFGGKLEDVILSHWCDLDGASKDLRNIVMESQKLNPKYDLEDVQNALTCLDGVYVSKVGNSFRFSHSLFQNIVTYLYKEPEFVLKYGTGSFIKDRVRINESFPEDDEYVLVFNGDRYFDSLTTRLINDLKFHPETGAYFIVNNHYIDNDKLLTCLRKSMDESLLENLDCINTLFKNCLMTVYKNRHAYSEIEREMRGPCYYLTVMLIEKGADCNMFLDRPCKCYPIHIAARVGSSKLAELMLNHGCSPTAIDLDGLSAIHYLIRNNKADANLKLAELFLSKEISLKSLKWSGLPLLHYLAMYGGRDTNVQMAKWLIEHGCSVSDVDNAGQSILHYVVQYCEDDNSLNLAELFIKSGCSVNVIDKNKESLLHMVAMYDKGDSSLQLANLFLKHGCSVNVKNKSKHSILHSTVMHCGGNTCVGLAKLFLEHGCPVNITDNFGQNVLHSVVLFSKDNSISLAELFLEYKCCVNDTDELGKSVLYYVVRYMKDDAAVTIANILIKNGCSVKGKSKSRKSILHYVTKYGKGQSSVPLALLFIENGCDVNGVDVHGRTILHYLTINSKNNDCVKLAELFLEKGFFVGNVSESGLSLLHFVLRYCDGDTKLQLADLLLKYGCPVDKTARSDQSILQYVIKYSESFSHIQHFAKLFIDKYECRVDVLDELGRSLLHCVVLYGKSDSVLLANLFINYGSPVNVATEKGHTLLHYVVMYSNSDNNLPLLKLFVGHGCPVNTISSSGQSVLTCVIANDTCENAVQIAEYLINRGCDVRYRDSSGRSILHYVAEHNHNRYSLELADLFIKYGCHVDAVDDSEESILHYIAKKSESYNSVKLAELLLKHGCPVNNVDVKGRSVLHYVARNSSGEYSLELAKFFIQNRCSVFASDDKNKSVLHYVIEHGSGERMLKFADILLKQGCPVNSTDLSGWSMERYIMQYCKGNDRKQMIDLLFPITNVSELVCEHETML